MTDKALKKILTLTVMKEYPQISEIIVIPEDNLGFTFDVYKVFIGITPENARDISFQKLKERVVQFSSYILDSKKEKLGQVLIYNPNN